MTENGLLFQLHLIESLVHKSSISNSIYVNVVFLTACELGTDIEMSWKGKWNNIAYLNKLCLVNWSAEEAILGQSDCDIHRLRNSALDSLVRPILENDFEKAIRIVPWDDGTFK